MVANKSITAIIPAAGKGTRLRPLTDYIPKELLILGDKPVLGHILEMIKSLGIDEVGLVVGHKKGTILDYVKDGSLFGLSVFYIYQSSPLGLGHAIHITKPYVSTPYIGVFLGDTIISPMSSIKAMFDRFQELGDAFGAILVERISNPEKYGVVRFDENYVIKDAYEKPTDPEIKKRFEINGEYYTIAGVYIFSTKIYDYLAKTKPGYKNEIQLTDAIKLALENRERIYAFPLEGTRMDIGTFDSYLDAQRYWLSKH